MRPTTATQLTTYHIAAHPCDVGPATADRHAPDPHWAAYWAHRRGHAGPAANGSNALDELWERHWAHRFGPLQRRPGMHRAACNEDPRRTIHWYPPEYPSCDVCASWQNWVRTERPAVEHLGKSPRLALKHSEPQHAEACADYWRRHRDSSPRRGSLQAMDLEGSESADSDGYAHDDQLHPERAAQAAATCSLQSLHTMTSRLPPKPRSAFASHGNSPH